MRTDEEYENGELFISIEPVPKEYFEIEDWHTLSAPTPHRQTANTTGTGYFF